MASIIKPTARKLYCKCRNGEETHKRQNKIETQQVGNVFRYGTEQLARLGSFN